MTAPPAREIPGNLPRNRPAHLCVVRVSGDGQEKWWRCQTRPASGAAGGWKIVADISPRDPEPGLRAFVCSECGAVESVLIYPDNHFGPKDPTYNGKRC